MAARSTKAVTKTTGKPSTSSKPRTPPNVRLQAPELTKVLLTVDEAAYKLSTSRASCYRLMRIGQLKYILVGSTRRIPVAAIDTYVNQQLHGAGWQATA